MLSGLCLWTDHGLESIDPIAALSDEEIVPVLRELLSISQVAHDHAEEYWYGNPSYYQSWLCGPSVVGSPDDFWRKLADEVRSFKERDAARNAKKIHMKRRRGHYSSQRSDLYLLLLGTGAKNQCAECDDLEDLTIDHIKPLSKGGTDDVANLRFLCRSCNSTKGDRVCPVA